MIEILGVLGQSRTFQADTVIQEYIHTYIYIYISYWNWTVA